MPDARPDSTRTPLRRLCQRLRRLLDALLYLRPAPTPPAWLARVRIPQTAQGWQLYADEPGADTAAAELAAGAITAAAEIDEVLRRFVACMTAYSNLGATDTEPSEIARELFTRITLCAINKHL